MKARDRTIVLCEGLRTPIGHLSKSLASVLPETLLKVVIEQVLHRASLDPGEVDGAIIGWVGQGSHAPNVARIGMLKAGIPERAYAHTIQCNCVSGIEAISSAARRILTGEGDLYMAGGTESMSTFPYAIRGARSKRLLRNIDLLKANWSGLLDDPDINVVDCITEGLTDPVKHINMAQTAEICAQKYSISRREQDEFAFETFKRCIEASESGFYKTHTTPVIIDGEELLAVDEYPALRKKRAVNKETFEKAPVLFDSHEYPFSRFYKEFGRYLGRNYTEGETTPTVTLFNSCVRSDAAACVIVTSWEKARDLGLEVLAQIRSWGYIGYDPAFMGIAPAFATDAALKQAGIAFDDLDAIELHEAFAATVLSTFKVGREEFGHGWKEKWLAGQVNPNGGSIPLGHPLAATGTRLILNLVHAMKGNLGSRFGLAAACASGGVGGAMILEKVE